MISRTDIHDMTDAQDEAPERIWLQEPVGLEHERSWCAEQQSDDDTPYVRHDLARAKIDHLKEIFGYAIGQWEDWVRDQFEGTSKFAGAMADIEATRAAVRDSLFADLARPSQAGDARVARLESIVRRFIALPSGAWHPERHATDEAELMADARAALAAMDTPKGGGDE